MPEVRIVQFAVERNSGFSTTSGVFGFLYVTVYAEIGRLSTQSITRYGEGYILCLIMAKLRFSRQRLL